MNLTRMQPSGIKEVSRLTSWILRRRLVPPVQFHGRMQPQCRSLIALGFRGQVRSAMQEPSSGQAGELDPK